MGVRRWEKACVGVLMGQLLRVYIGLGVQMGQAASGRGQDAGRHAPAPQAPRRIPTPETRYLKPENRNLKTET